MLVFSQKENSKTFITVPPSDVPTVIEVVLLEIQGAKTRIGYTAPRSAIIDREAVHLARLADAKQREASQPA